MQEHTMDKVVGRSNRNKYEIRMKCRTSLIRHTISKHTQ